MNEQQIFAEARRKSSTERAAFLTKQCGDDQKLQRRVERLLRMDSSHAHLFERKPASILSDLTTGPEDHSSNTGQNLVERVLQQLEPTANQDCLGQLGHYEIHDIIGRGGFGVVFSAVDQKLKRPVAIKVLSPALASGVEHRERFLIEARSAAAIQHENVVRIYAVEESPLPYIVMELITGCTLQTHLAETGPLTSEEVVDLAAQIARGLEAAHAAGIVHRDIKPANILLEQRTPLRAKLTDFGLAHPVDDAEIATGMALLGTPAYMAPEQASGKTVDHRSDLFSFGSVMYAMCCGNSAFSESNTITLLKNVENAAPQPLADRVRNLPPELIAIVERLHQKNPAQRYQAAEDVSRDLQKFATVKRLRKTSTRHGWKRPAITVAVAAILFASLASSWMTPEAEQAHAIRPLASRNTETPEITTAEVSLNQDDAEQLVYDVLAEMTKRNPGFDPRLTDYEITGNRVTFFRSVLAPDFSPLAVLTDLERLELYCLEGTIQKTDLSFVSGMKNLKTLKTDGLPLVNLKPLEGLSLKSLSIWCWNWQGQYSDGDLSPLKGMPLTQLNAGGAHIQSLEPLRGAPLVDLCLNSTSVTDLSPLNDMHTLKILTVAKTGVEDLTPLTNLDLRELEIGDCSVHDLSPLTNVPVQILSIVNLKIKDHTPLRQMPLVSLRMDYDPLWDRTLLELIPHVQQLNHKPIAHYKHPDTMLETLMGYVNDLTKLCLQTINEFLASTHAG